MEAGLAKEESKSLPESIKKAKSTGTDGWTT